MNIKDEYEVRAIQSWECKEWLLAKHYAKRVPPINYAFGLYDSAKTLSGVCTYGIPASRFEFSIQPYELNRLVVNDRMPSNTLSYFLMGTLRLITLANIIVSYADENQGHHGYIYQATNWIYTGRSSAEKRIFIDGKETHRKTLYNVYGTSSLDGIREEGKDVTFEAQMGKHRYFQFTGNKRDASLLRKEVLAKFPSEPYPKGDNIRYDASYEPTTQNVLF